MTVQSISASLASFTQKTAGAGGSQTGNSPAAALQQEATETMATTRKEAQQGDPVARRKLQQLEARDPQQQPATTTNAPVDGRGALVDHDA